MVNREREQNRVTRINAESGDARARFFMAALCFEDDGPDGGEQVLHWLTLSADGGEAQAAEALASIYLDGKIAHPNGRAKWSAPKDATRAAFYLERLVDYSWGEPWSAKSPNALWGLRDAPETLLARMYLSGEGVAKDVGRGLWLHHLATIGLSYECVSMKELGAMYHRGAGGLPRDIERASYWMLKYDIRNDRANCDARYLREHFLRCLDSSVPGHSEIQEAAKQDAEAFMRGLDSYLGDEVEREWYLWRQSISAYNNRYDRGYDGDGNYVLGIPNPYEKLRSDKQKAEEYLAPLCNKRPNGGAGI